MNPFLADFLPNLAANLATQVVQYVAPKLKKQLVGSEKERALQRCFYAGIVAIVTTARSASAEELHLLADIFTDFFRHEDVQYEMAGLLRGEALNRPELLQQFAQAGFEAETLPGVDPKTAFILFENAFLETAFQEPELQALVQTGFIVRQTRIQQDLLTAVQDLIRFLKKAHQEKLRLQNGQLISQEIVSGQPIVYQIPVVIGEPAAADWETHYLKTLFTRCDELDLSPIDPALVQTEKGAAEIPIRLSDVFTTLYLKNLTRSQEQSVTDALRKPADEMRLGQKETDRLPIQALEAVAASRRLVILGQPGAGKSTLVNHLTTQLARRRAGLEVKPEHLMGWSPDEKPIPVRIILRRLAAWLPASTPPDKTGLIWAYLEKSLEDAGCKECFKALKAKLIHEGGIIFFDGLDEVSATDAAAKRSLIKTAIEQFAAPLDKCRIVLTCREYAYQAGAAWRLSEAQFPVVELALFKLEQIEQFTKTWYGVTGPAKGWDATKCQNEAKELYRAIQEWPHLFELAQYPLLLTLMSQVHGRYGYLPKDRADLYQRTVELMLAHWENRIVRDLGSERQVENDLIYQLNLRTDTLLAALQEVAFRAHERQEKEPDRGTGAADIHKTELREILGHTLGSFDQAEMVIQYTQQRAGLLLARDNFTYAFPHRTFQEYLAAGFLLKQAEFDKLLCERVQRDLNWWREVFLLAAGSAKGTPRYITALIDQLLFEKVSAATITPEKMSRAILAGQALYETEFFKQVESEKKRAPGRYTDIFERIRDWLLYGLTTDKIIPPTDRAEAGNKLAQLGDPRLEVTTLEKMEFCYVPAGTFRMGSPEDDEMAWKDERPLHPCEIPYPYWINRFPITNAQFDYFVSAEDGYREDRWWTQAGLKWRGERRAPEKYGGVYDLPNHPVVAVRWYEALAFTRWLTVYFQARQMIPANWRFQLPSEAEWEKAARGGEKVPQEFLIQPLNQINLTPKVKLIKFSEIRRYPWGQAPDTNRMNYKETGIDSTNAVGCFPGGRSVYGCEELSGNAWEWTRSLFGKVIEKKEQGRTSYSAENNFPYPYQPDDGRENLEASTDIARVVRGGAFGNGPRLVRCAVRYGNGPRNWIRDCGFRVLLSLF